MRKHPGMVPLAALAAILATGVALAAKAPGPPSDTPAYNEATEIGLKGTVTEVKTHASTGGYTDLHLVVETAKGPMEIHVGPVAYLAKHGFEFAKGDEVIVVGAKVPWEGADVLVAREITRAGRALTVRSFNGSPAWPKNLKA